MNRFLAHDPLVQAFLSAANEALAVQNDIASRLNLSLGVSPAQEDQARASWDLFRLEIDRLTFLCKKSDLSCPVAAGLNQKFLMALERFRSVSCPPPGGEDVATRLYQECLSAGTAFTRLVASQACVS